MTTDIPVRKLGFLSWEATLTLGHVDYCFVSMTAHGAKRKAINYLISLKENT